MIQTRKKVSVWVLIITLLASSLFFAPTAAAADENEAQVGFYISANLPENQRDRGKTYYDLHLDAGSEQKISFIVGNNGAEPIAVNLKINNAYTNTAGGIGYQLPNIQDESLEVSIEDMTELSDDRVELKPNESKEVFITIKAPAENFAGEKIGGIVATKELTDEETDKDIAIINEYSYIIGLVVSESEEIVNPNISFVGIKADLINYKTAAVHSVRNSAPILMDDVSMKIDIYKQGSPKVLWSLERADIKLAPSSLMDYTFYLGEEEIEAGSYLSKISINWQGHQWNFEDTFEIELSTAHRLNTDSIKLDAQETSLISKPLAIVLVTILVLILLALIVIVIRMYKNITKAEDEEKDQNQNEGGE